MIYLLYVAGLVFSFLAPISPINMYYRALVAFDVIFLVPYYLNLLSVLTNLLAIFPLYSYIQRTPTFSAQFCRWLFGCRLALDILGRSYESHLLKAASYQSHRLVWLVLGAFILCVLPSYWAILRYGFQEENDQIKPGGK